MYCKNKASWLSVNSNGVTDYVKLCAEHARILHKAIPCHKAYQVPPYVSLMVGAGGTEERGDRWYRSSMILSYHDSLVLYTTRLPRSIMYPMNAYNYDQNMILPFKSNIVEIKV